MSSRSDSLYALTTALQPTRRAWLHAMGTVLVEPEVSLALARSVLHVARLGDGTQQSVLAEELGVHPATLVHLLDQAERVQWLERRTPPDNRRIKTVHLQPEGRRRAALLERAVEVLRETLLHDISRDDIETATRVLRTLRDRARDHAETEQADAK